MILMLFGAVAVAGVLGTGYMATIKGPGRTLSESSRENSIENNMIAATKLVVSGDAAKQDCDADGIVEPLAFRTGAGPTGGGLVPLDSGAAKNDPWGKALGYCVWDHGKKSKSDNVVECGGSSANRLQGGNVTTENVLAIVSAGKDGIFQTTCNAWVDANTDKIADTPLIVTTAGSDDIVKKDTIESLLVSGTLAQLSILPDSACVAGAEGTMRYENGVAQVCTTTAPNGWNGDPATLPPPTWKEIGGSSGTSAGNFNNLTGLNPLTTQTSNQITITGFYGTKTITVDNGATILVNGVVMGSSTTITQGAQVSLRGPSAALIADTASGATNDIVYTLSVGAVKKPWTLTTRARTAPVLVISPASVTGMNVTGTVGTATGSSVPFTVTNNGERTSAVFALPLLSNPGNFAVAGTNTCTSATLAPSATCSFYIQPRAGTPGAISSNMTISATPVTSNTVTLSGTASGWSCTLPWGGTIIHGTSTTSYSQTAPAYSGVCSSYQQTRTCTNGVLSAGTNNQYCNHWVVGGWGGCSASCGGGSQSRSVMCYRQPDNVAVADGLCGGTKPVTSQACNTHSCCGGTMVAGFCYYLAANNQSCNELCASRGGVNMSGTHSYSGTGGSSSGCWNTLAALGRSNSTFTQSNGCYMGCGISGSSTRYRHWCSPGAYATNPSWKSTGVEILCACYN